MRHACTEREIEKEKEKEKELRMLILTKTHSLGRVCIKTITYSNKQK